MKSPSRIPSSIPYLHRCRVDHSCVTPAYCMRKVVARMVMPNETGGVLEQRF